MGLLSWFTGAEQRSAEIEQRDVSWDLLAANVMPDAAIPTVSPQAAESFAAIAAAVSLISSAIANLPLNVFRITETGRELAADHPVHRLFNGNWSEFQTAPEGLESMVASCLLYGSGHAEIIRGSDGAPRELKTVPFGRIGRVDLPGDRFAYDVTSRMGGTRRLLASEIFSIYDRVDEPGVSRSRLQRCAEAISGVAAAERFANAFFSNGAALSGVLSHPGRLSEGAGDRLRQKFEDKFTGTAKSGKVAILQEGTRWTTTSANPDQSQALETRRFAVQQVARVFNCPPLLLADMEHSNFSNAVQLNQHFLTYCLSPLLRKIESRIMHSLFSEAGRRTYLVEFDTDLLQRTNQLERFQAYRISREIGLYNANELRAFENANPREDEGGNEYFTPQHMANPQEAEPKDNA